MCLLDTYAPGLSNCIKSLCKLFNAICSTEATKLAILWIDHSEICRNRESRPVFSGNQNHFQIFETFLNYRETNSVRRYVQDQNYIPTGSYKNYKILTNCTLM